MTGRLVQVSTSPGGLPKTAVPGTLLLLGAEVRLEVTSYPSPCLHIAGAFADRHYARISPDRHPGWSRVYARVLAEGTIRPGGPVRLLEARAPEGCGRAGAT